MGLKILLSSLPDPPHPCSWTGRMTFWLSMCTYVHVYIYLLSLPWYSLSPTDRHYRNPYKCFSDPFSRNQRNPNSRCEQSGRIGLAGVYEEAPVRVLSVSFHLHIPPLYYITQLQPLQAAPSSLFHCICGVMLFKSFSF